MSQYPLFYEVTVGTVEGGSDILQWQETKQTYLKFGLPSTVKHASKVSLHVYVRAICAGGTYEDIKFVILHQKSFLLIGIIFCTQSIIFKIIH